MAMYTTAHFEYPHVECAQQQRLREQREMGVNGGGWLAVMASAAWTAGVLTFAVTIIGALVSL